MKINDRVKIKKLDMNNSLYSGYPKMKKFEGKIGIYIEESPFKPNCAHVIVKGQLWVLKKKDIEKYD